MIKRIVKKIVYYKTFAGLKIFGISYAVKILERGDPSYINQVLKSLGAKLGKNIKFKGNLLLDNVFEDRDSTGDFSNLEIADNCYIGKHVFLDLPAKIILRDDVVLGAGVKIFTHSDCGDRLMSKSYPRVRGDVILGKGSWIGAGTIILANVEIGASCTIGAGSVVNKSIPPYSLAAGNPAKVIRSLPKE